MIHQAMKVMTPLKWFILLRCSAILTVMITMISRNPFLVITDMDDIGNNADTDDDNDSMDDAWELANGLDPLDDGSINVDNGPNGDIDSDGIYNLQEYLASTA